MQRKKINSVQAERKPEKKVRQHQSTFRLFSQAEIPSELLRDLLRAAEYGDIPTVQEIVVAHPMLDTNSPDMFGRTALQIAVANEHAEIVEILLDHSSPANIYLALLLAINHNYENITELILQHPTYRQYHDKWPELAAKLPDTSPFSEDISPIILACQKNLFGIVHLLLQDGMRVPVPHHFDCTCEKCQESRQEDQMKHAKRRLNEFRALTSEAYISLTSPDPFQTAFELCKEMELRATWEKHFKREYKALIALMRRYVVKLLDCVRTHDELQTILDWSGNVGTGIISAAADGGGGDTVLRKRQAQLLVDTDEQLMTPQPLSRLRVAIHYRQKEFVSHWACQQELMRTWLRGFSQYQGSSSPARIFTNLMLTLLAYPVMMVFHWVKPESKLGRAIRKPMVKFVSYSTSYLTFLGILYVITVTPTGFYAVPQKLSEIYLPADDYQPMYDIIAYVKGVTVTTAPASAFNDEAANRQQQNLYSIIRDFCNESRLNGVVPLKEPDSRAPVTESIGRLSPAGVWRICKIDKDFIVRPSADNWICWIVSVWLFGLFCSKIRQIAHGTFSTGFGGTNRKWGVLPSIVRSPFDMIDFAQLALFAAAFACRFYVYVQVTESVVFFLALRPSPSNYALFPNYLYWLVSDRIFFHPSDPMTISEVLFATGSVFSFARLLYIFPALEVFGPCYLALMRVVKDIFAFFFVFLVVFAAFMIGTLNIYWYFNPELRHMLQLNSSYEPEIPVEERFGNIEVTFRTVFWSLFGLGESDYMSLNNFGNGSMLWVERVGFIIYGAYNVVVVCCLLNMLIAMMAKSYEVIKQNSEMEWKFARTILFLEYIAEHSPVIPTPFNLIPNPRYLWEMTLNFLNAFGPCRRSFAIVKVLNRSQAVYFTDDVASSQQRQSQRVTVSSSDDLVTAPVQIRIEPTTDDEVMTTNVDDDPFTVETVQVPGGNNQPITQRAALRVEHGTMTSFDDDNDDERQSCCNYCFLTKLFAKQPEKTTPIPTRSPTAGVNFYLNVPSGNSFGPATSSTAPTSGGSAAGTKSINRRNIANPALLKFRAVVFNILRRYILGLSTQSDSTVDLEEIKQDISSFRFEVLNLLTDSTQLAGCAIPTTGSLNHQTAGINQPSITRGRRMSRVNINSSPLSIKSFSAVDSSTAGMIPPELIRENSISNNNLLVVSSPANQFLTPTSELFFNSEQNSPIRPLSDPSPASSSMSRSPRVPKSYAPYRRRSLIPSSIVGSFMPTIVNSGPSPELPNIPQAENEDETDNNSAVSGTSSEHSCNSGNNGGGNTTPPSSRRVQHQQRPQRSSPARQMLQQQRSSGTISEAGQAFLEEVDEETEQG